MTKRWAGCKIWTGATGSTNCAGISLLYKEGEETQYLYRVENDKVVGTNVITFELITRTTAKGQLLQYYVVRCYIPPSDKDGTTQKNIEHALDMMPKGAVPLVST